MSPDSLRKGAFRDATVSGSMGKTPDEAGHTNTTAKEVNATGSNETKEYTSSPPPHGTLGAKGRN